MSATIINGKNIAQKILSKLKENITTDRSNGLRAPGLAVILVGNQNASKLYVKNKRISCKEVGIQSFSYDLPKDVTQQKLITLINKLNTDENVDGILVQLPLPKHINTFDIITSIAPEKDVDGFHPCNLGKLAQCHPFLRSCTPYGIILLLEELNIKLEGLNATVVGASKIVGRPMALELLRKNATVTICHKYTKNLEFFVKNADLLVVAVGKKELIKGDWIKKGAIVIDVGINRTEDDKIIGDVEFDEACKHASFITPVPGGVGPMTVATLLHNTYIAFKNLIKKDNLN